MEISKFLDSLLNENIVHYFEWKYSKFLASVLNENTVHYFEWKYSKFLDSLLNENTVHYTVILNGNIVNFWKVC